MAFKMKGMAFKDGQSPMRRMVTKEQSPARMYNKKSPTEMKDLSGDGKITKKDVLIGRGVIEKDSPAKLMGVIKGVGTVAKGVGKAAAKVGKGIGKGVKKVAEKVKAGKVARKAKKVAKSAANDAIKAAGGTVKETLGSQLKSAGVDMAKNVATDQITGELNRDKTKKVASTSDFSNINFGG